MVRIRQYIYLLHTAITILVSEALAGSAYYELYRNVFNGYQSFLRPVKNASTPVLVFLGYELVSVMDINEADQKMITRGWLEVSWYDELLSWNASDYSGIDSVTLPLSKLWVPDLTLLNDVKGYQLLANKGGQVRLLSSGKVVWFLGLVVETRCTINIVDFPFDAQECSLHFSQWSSKNSEMDIEPSSINNSPLINNGEWLLINTSCYRDNVTYLDTVLVSITFTVQRKPMTFVISGIIPMILLSVVSLSSFMLPLGSEEKVSMGVTVLLSFSVFVSVINDLLPDVSDSVSIFRLYVVMMLIVKVLTTLASVTVLHFYYKPMSKPLPGWLQKCLFTFCRIQSTVHPDTNNYPDSKQNRSPDWKIVAKTLNTVCFITLTAITMGVNVICFSIMIF